MKNLGVINLNLYPLSSNIQSIINKHTVEVPITFLNMNNIKEEIKNFNISGLVIFADQYTDNLDIILSLFISYVGPLSDLVLIISDNPSINFITNVFEFGINNIQSSSFFHIAFKNLKETWQYISQDLDSLEHLILSSIPSIKSGKPALIKRVLEALEMYSDYDYIGVYCKALCLEALGEFKKAIQTYELSMSLNPFFMPNANALSECLLNCGQTTKAIKILQNLDVKNPYFVTRKANLAIAAIAINDLKSAREYFQQSLDLSNEHPKMIEAKIQFLLKNGKNTEAFKLLDNITEAGVLFCSLINNLSIQLSLKGKIRESLALYQKIYNIVRSELKYKISINAALACYRANIYDQALYFLDQAQRDYGSKLDKITKIKEEILKAKMIRLKENLKDIKKAV